MPVAYDFGSKEFDDAVRAACHEAFLETLPAGLPVFYRDADGLNVMQCPDGRRWAELLARLRTTGKAMPVNDSLIAATTVVHGLAVATRNRADFVDAGVRIVDLFVG